MQNKLPPAFVKFVINCILSGKFPTATSLHRSIILRWTLWYDGHEANAIPGYDQCPPPATSFGFPAGWTLRNFRKIYRDTFRSAFEANVQCGHKCLFLA